MPALWRPRAAESLRDLRPKSAEPADHARKDRLLGHSPAGEQGDSEPAAAREAFDDRRAAAAIAVGVEDHFRVEAELRRRRPGPGDRRHLLARIVGHLA